jgi:hypothetical protein
MVSAEIGIFASYQDLCYTGEHLDAITHPLDSWYVWLNKGDTVTFYLWIQAVAHNTDTSDQSFRFGYVSAGTVCVLNWTDRNLLYGEGAPMIPQEWMPDVKQADFIKAIKEIFNLRFFVDRFKHKVYIEPVDTFFTDNVVDLTPYQIFDTEPKVEELSLEYTKKINLKWIEDDTDLAVKEYRLQNTEIYDKNITLNSEYVKVGITDMINSLIAYTPFMTPVGYMNPAYAWILPTIWGAKIDTTLKYPSVRNPSAWKPRLFKWEGMTANPGGTWTYGSTPYTTYPKVSQLNMEDVYLAYWQKTIHWIDKGKLIPIYIRIPQFLLNQLMTVVNDSATEGFRAKYKFTINGEVTYGILNNIETDGIKAKCEFLVRK